MPLIIPKAAWNGGCTPSLKSWVLDTVWSWNFHQRCPVRNYDNWSYRRPGHMTGVQFTGQKPIFDDIGKNENWFHQSTSFIKGDN